LVVAVVVIRRIAFLEPRRPRRGFRRGWSFAVRDRFAGAFAGVAVRGRGRPRSKWIAFLEPQRPRCGVSPNCLSGATATSPWW